MKQSELENYIHERLGENAQRFDRVDDWTDLKLRYHWIGDKLFDIDSEYRITPYLLPRDFFLLFALDPSVEMRQILKVQPVFASPQILKKLIESKRKLPWDDAYFYFDELKSYNFKYLGRLFPLYRDELLQIDESSIPKGRRLIPNTSKSEQKIKSILFDYLGSVNSTIMITDAELKNAISRYRWFGDEVLDIYRSNPLLLFRHFDAEFLAHILYPHEKLDKLVVSAPGIIKSDNHYKTAIQKIKYDMAPVGCSWSQIWGYVKSRPVSADGDIRDAIKLQFRNQSRYDII